jgi:hypothetical protein
MPLSRGAVGHSPLSLRLPRPRCVGIPVRFCSKSSRLESSPETWKLAGEQYLENKSRGSGMGTPLSFVSTTEELLGSNNSGSGLESREYGRRDSSC